MLRKVEKEKEASQVEAHRLVEEKMAMEAENEKIEEEIAQLRQELQDLRAGFAAQKKGLEVDYQKQVDDMLFCGYWCCMKKHDIANDTLNFPFDDEDDEFFSGPTLGDGLEPRERCAPRDGPSNEDDSHDEQTWFFFPLFFLASCGLDFYACTNNVCSFEHFTSILNAPINFPSSLLFLVVCLCYIVSRSNFY